MSDSSQFPVGPRTPGAAQGQIGPEPNARLIGVPNELRSVSQILRLEGQVVETKTNGVSRILTERGEIETRIQDERARPRDGENVRIEINPGRPPKTARVSRSAPPSQQPAEPLYTPLDVDIRHPSSTRPAANPEQPAAPPAQNRPLDPILTLRPIPAENLPQSLSPPAQEISTRLPAVLPTAQPLPPIAITLTQALPLILIAETQTGRPHTPDITQSFLNENQLVTGDILQRSLATKSALQDQSLQNQGTKSERSFFQNILRPEALNSFFQVPKAPAIETQQFIPPHIELVPVTPAQKLLSLKSPGAETAFLNIQKTPALSIPFLPATIIPDGAILSLTTDTLKPALKIEGEAVEIKSFFAGTPFPQIALLSDSSPPPSQQAVILQNQKAGQIPASVIGQTADSKTPVVAVFFSDQTGPAFFGLESQSALSAQILNPGTQLAFMPTSNASAHISMTQPAIAQPAMPFFLTPGPWPVLQDILQSLQQASPAIAQTMTNITPAPANAPAQLGPAALFFIAALRAGDLSQWLGDKTADMLKRAGRSNLLGQLSREGSALSRMAAEPVSQDWRALTLPLFHEGEMQKIALYYKREQESGENADKKGGQTRFIFDLELDVIGPFQLDGLFRESRLDMIVRTQQKFSEPMQMEMRRLYTKALEETRINGELAFQNHPDQWVTITPDRKSPGVSA